MAKSAKEVSIILEKYRDQDGVFDFSGQDFSGKDFSGWDFDGANFDGANFRGANFMYADFGDANFMYADFRRAYFRGANFSNANFMYADFSDANFSDANFSDANFSSAKAKIYTQMVNTSRPNNTIYYFPTLKIFSTGCFTGTEADLVKRVNVTHANNKHLHDRYMRVIANLKTEYAADQKYNKG